MTGLLADELIDAETFNTRIEVDRRATKSINGTTLTTFQDIQRARATADLVASRFRQFDPTNPQGPEIQALAGFTYVIIAESYCNGVPDEQGERRRHVQLRRTADRPPAAHRGGREDRLRRSRRRQAAARQRSTWPASARDAH